MKYHYDPKKVLEAHNKITQQAPDATARHLLHMHAPRQNEHLKPYCSNEYCYDNLGSPDEWPCTTYIDICQLHHIKIPSRMDLETDD